MHSRSISRNFILGLLVSTLFGVVVGEYDENGNDVRVLTLTDDVDTRYQVAMAAFGNQIRNGTSFNLMVTPEQRDYSLCRFPSTLRGLLDGSPDDPDSAIEDYNLRGYIDRAYKDPIAILVSAERCSIQQKARVLLQMKKKFSDQIQMMLVVDTWKRNGDTLVTLRADPASTEDLSEYDDIGIVYLPYAYSGHLESAINQRIEGASPFFLAALSVEWNFPMNVSAFDEPVVGNFSRASDDDDNGNLGRSQGDPDYGLYWFRFVLFGLLILSPCMRAGYLFYAGGGRIHLRRNENGRIIGFLYIPPMAFWAAGRLHTQENRSAAVLTEEQFNALPEIEYQPGEKLIDGETEDEVDTDEDNVIEDSESEEHEDLSNVSGNVSGDNDNIKITGGEKVDEMGDCVEPDIKIGSMRHDTAGNSAELGGVSSSVDPINPFDSTDADIEAEHDLETGEGSTGKVSEDACATVAASGEASEETNDQSIRAPADVPFGLPEATNETLDASKKSTTCDECSICIDDFEPGERITLLPRCQHAFHKECIKTWLVTRQGCCPLCKTNVLPEDDEVEEVAGDESVHEV